MSNEKKKTDPAPPAKEPSPARPVEDALRVATLLRQEGISEIEAKGFLAGAGLKSTDRLTVAAFRKRFSAWRNQPASADKPAGRETR